MNDDDLIERFIELDASHPGPAGARLVEYGVPVWVLIGCLHVAEGDASRVASDYEVPCEYVEAAQAYYKRHKSAIDARLDAAGVSAA